MAGLSNLFLERFLFPLCKNFIGTFSVDTIKLVEHHLLFPCQIIWEVISLPFSSTNTTICTTLIAMRYPLPSTIITSSNF